MFLRRTLAVFGVLALFLSAAGCGDDDTDADTGTNGEPTGTLDDDTGEPSDSASDTYDDDLRVAEAAVLTLNDMPVGWSSKPRDDEEDDDGEFDEQVAECMGIPVEELADSANPKAESETFVAEDDSEVEAEVVVAPTVDEAITDFERATSSQFLTCIREVLPAIMERAAEEEGSEVTITDTSIGPLRIEDSGDRSAAFRLTISVGVDAFNVDVFADILIAQVGRATVQLSAMSFFNPTDVSFSQSLLDTMVDRIDADTVS